MTFRTSITNLCLRSATNFGRNRPPHISAHSGLDLYRRSGPVEMPFAGLQRSFSLEIAPESVHQFGPQRPPLRLLGLGIGEVAPDFLKTFFSLFVALQSPGLFQGSVEGLKGQFLESEGANAFDGLHHGLVAKAGEMLGVDFLQPQLAGAPLGRLPNTAPDEVR